MTFPRRRTGLFGFVTLSLALGLLSASLVSISRAQDDDEPTERPVVKKRADGGKAAKKPDKKGADTNPFPNRIPAAELDGGIEWLNTSGEISLKDVRGKVVLLDFWTFCCINCIHVLPDLAFLEKKYDKELVVIGVHSAKFDNEKETGNIRKAILRYEIAHPVVNDAKMTIWRKFGVNSWPTLVLIDPEGFYCGYLSGEGNRDDLDKIIAKVIAYHKAKGTLDETPVHFDLERKKQPDLPLKFPGKVLADPAGQRLFISDSNHNRIVVASLDGQLQDVIGNGQIGSEDGAYDKAQFDHPQGMCLVGDHLYVADTENHLIRQIDLTKKTVATLAGTGKQAHFREPQTGKLRETSLNSPWDLYAADGTLYIAMAGPHQLWSHELGTDLIAPYAGSGREDIKNGSLKESALAQPSGITSDGTFLYVVDSEGSSVRKITTKPIDENEGSHLEVTTIVGSSDLPNGRCLFEFGDVDGIGDLARLQHPLGIVFHPGELFVADSYNHKIKRIDLETRECTTWLGTGKDGASLFPAQLAEPAGLTIAGETLYIADTNNHRILAVDLQSKQTKEFAIAGLQPPQPVDEPVAGDDDKDSQDVQVNRQLVQPGAPLKLEVQFELPDDFQLNEAFPAKFTVTAAENQTLVLAEHLGKKSTAKFKTGKAVVELPIAENAGMAELKVSLTYGYCRKGSTGLCKVGTAQWTIPVEVSETAKSSVVSLTATPQ